MEELEAKIKSIIEYDSRYGSGAYELVLRAVEQAVDGLEKPRHLAAREVLDSIRTLGVEKFGAFRGEVFSEWGVASASDVGNIVYNLIAGGLLLADEKDDPADFDIEYNLAGSGCREGGLEPPASGVTKIE
ncbi:MAG: Minf_1886 family protein [Victivallaceae bacterium]|nr:Minf_1886 family protein [Victivallaceae bacterium]